MTPFKPSGEKARWRVLYELLVNLSVGDVITYDEMAEALELDAQEDRHAIQMAMRRAAKELEEENNHALDVVANKGYRVVEPAEHLTLARKQQRKSSKALVRGHSKVVHVDLNGMDVEIRKAFEVTAAAFTGMMDMQRRMFHRQNELDKAIGSTTNRVERSETEISELKARLERLEAERPD